MEYTAFYELYWDGRSDKAQRKLLNEQPPEFRAAWRIFGVLSDRKGFDWWWSDVDDEIKDEAFAACVAAARAALREGASRE